MQEGKTRRNSQLVNNQRRVLNRKKTVQEYRYFSIYDTDGIIRSISSPCTTSTEPPRSSQTDYTATSLAYHTQIIQCISSTKLSRIFIAKNLQTEQLLVIKAIETDKPITKYIAQNEIQILSTVSHENIIKYYGTKVITSTTLIYLEYFNGVELFYLIKQTNRIEYPVIMKIFWQLSKALVYLHSQRICHLDLKPENILVSVHGRIKLIDFGVSQRALKNGQVQGHGGSVNYMAPEIENTLSIYNGYLADSWACGVILFLMANRYFPRRGNKTPHLTGTPQIIITITNLLLEINPVKRKPISFVYEANKEYCDPGEL
ncbi:hypothetical protein NEOKW01_1399 [Nematocida sp. AWRm80]|nr:hypothetical protein NEOKW01_1399 [Nematocida sp. AWRm80]